MAKFIFFLFIGLNTLNSFTQIDTPFILYEDEIEGEPYETGVTIEELWKLREQEALDAYEAITTLKNGKLLFLLNFKTKEYDHYIKFENFKGAESLKKKQEKENKSIIRSMDALFNFCPVIYMSSHETRYIVEEKFDSITFYNSNLIKDDSVKIKQGDFLVGEFDKVDQDESVYFPEDSTHAYGENKLSISAFVIRKPNMVQLRAPFPYYQRYHPFVKINKRFSGAILKMNGKLKSFEKREEPSYIHRSKLLKEINGQE